MNTERVSYFVVSIPGFQSYIFLEQLLDEGFGLEEVSLTTLLELAELKPNADNLV
jgi:hypothetical protein